MRTVVGESTRSEYKLPPQDVIQAVTKGYYALRMHDRTYLSLIINYADENTRLMVKNFPGTDLHIILT